MKEISFIQKKNNNNKRQHQFLHAHVKRKCLRSVTDREMTWSGTKDA